MNETNLKPRARRLCLSASLASVAVSSVLRSPWLVFRRVQAPVPLIVLFSFVLLFLLCCSTFHHPKISDFCDFVPILADFGELCSSFCPFATSCVTDVTLIV